MGIMAVLRERFWERGRHRASSNPLFCRRGEGFGFIPGVFGSLISKELIPRWGQAGFDLSCPLKSSWSELGKCWGGLEQPGIVEGALPMELDQLSGPFRSKPFHDSRTIFHGSLSAWGSRCGQAVLHRREDFPTSQRRGNSWNILSTAPSRALLSGTPNEDLKGLISSHCAWGN